MRAVKDFNEFLREGIVKKQSPDKSRSKSLIEESKNSYDVLKQIVKQVGITNKSSNNIIKQAYDIIMELVRAEMLLKGFNSSGAGSHAAEVSYLRRLNFSESDVQFTNQLRYFRNGIMYYGKVFDKEYAKKVTKFLDKFVLKLSLI